LALAVISDPHGNAVALETVLKDIEAEGVDRIVCLGDIIGYGPEPRACVDMIMDRCDWSLLGNHDFAALYEPTNFNPAAEASAYWTREQFETEPDEKLRAKRYAFLGGLHVRKTESLNGDGGEGGDERGRQFVAVHGSIRRPINEYVFPQDAINSPEKMRSLFELIDDVCLCGHSHVPGVFTDEPDFYPPDEAGAEMTYKFLEGERVIINVGSVGQPRDHDPRACYVILDQDKVRFKRVEYDFDATAKKIYAIEALSDWLGDRLYEGR